MDDRPDYPRGTVHRSMQADFATNGTRRDVRTVAAAPGLSVLFLCGVPDAAARRVRMRSRSSRRRRPSSLTAHREGRRFVRCRGEPRAGYGGFRAVGNRPCGSGWRLPAHAAGVSCLREERVRRGRLLRTPRLHLHELSPWPLNRRLSHGSSRTRDDRNNAASCSRKIRAGDRFAGPRMPAGLFGWRASTACRGGSVRRGAARRDPCGGADSRTGGVRTGVS